ncbi:MAG TPA: anti-sigma factor [Bryobacteraceae bacterium]|jgi:anti-sigma-K factor RskA
MTCAEFKEMFELYSLGLLESDERDEIEEHLAGGCAECQSNFKSAMAVNALLMSTVTHANPPSRLKRRVLAGFGIERSGWGWLGLLAAAGMLVLALWLSVQERERSAELVNARRQIIQITSERDQLQQAFTFFGQPDTIQVNFGQGEPKPPRGNVLVNSRLGVLLIASNLPTLQPGKTFEMWVIPKGGSPRPAGIFPADAQGTAVHMLSGPIDPQGLGAVAVSIEPEAGSRTPTTVIFAAPVPGA